MAPKTNPGAKVRQEGTSEDLERTSVREQQESKAGPQTAPPHPVTDCPPPSVWEGYSNAIPKGSLPWCSKRGVQKSGSFKERKLGSPKDRDVGQCGAVVKNTLQSESQLFHLPS